MFDPAGLIEIPIPLNWTTHPNSPALKVAIAAEPWKNLEVPRNQSMAASSAAAGQGHSPLPEFSTLNPKPLNP